MRRSTPDAVLVRRIAAGDLIAQRELCARHRLGMYSQAYAVLWDAVEAQLALSEAVEEVWRSAARFDPRTGSTQDWLVGLARDVALRRRALAQQTAT